jgi:hypothetical protein
MSGIVATLVMGTVVDQVDKSAGWVKIVTDDGRTGWLRETDLGPVAEAAPSTIAAERAELSSEIQAVEQTQLGTLVSRIEQVAEARQAEANRPAAGWQFATDAVKAVVGRNYMFHAFVALVAYTFMWIPGLVLNIVFLNQAGKDQNETGKAPEGKGCLLWLLWVFGIIPFVTIVLLVAIATLFASGSEP